MQSLWTNALWAPVNYGKLAAGGGTTCDPEQRFYSKKILASLTPCAKCHWKKTKLNRFWTRDLASLAAQQTPTDSLCLPLAPWQAGHTCTHVSDILIHQKKNVSLINSPRYFSPETSSKTIKNSFVQKRISKRNLKESELNEDDFFHLLCFNFYRKARLHREISTRCVNWVSKYLVSSSGSATN